ncbi:GNAT family N-acetyltransferase [Fulvivirgaceae bacterium PWU5]|uniref:GNAT family N-acetyltransferase n=1 Tax=Dawidia cretensis TaxID=2782350 RepID=A0AAP2E0J2_9BACT|nr:GNAT family N-acetyltransferase [Dawidia cretensis]MBT1710828.1 GNAT family N-acetyltransferase [Dawidia cretensis]
MSAFVFPDLIADGFVYSADRARLDVPYIHQYLSERSYWAQHIPLEIVQRSIDNALCFGIYHDGKQVGFARLVTDYATFGYLGDVFVDEAYRGRGLSKQLMQYIFEAEPLQGFRRMVLVTSDAQGLYSQYGFRPLEFPERYMELRRTNVYQKKSPGAA